MSKKYTTNFLEDTNGSTGSANQVLISTAAGIDWVDGSGSGIIGGPYLPLAGGTLTGALTGTTVKYNTQLSTSNSSGQKAFIGISSSSGAQKFKIYKNTNTGDGYARFKIDRAFDYGNSDQMVQEAIFQRRTTTKNFVFKYDGDISTSDDVYLEVYELSSGQVEIWLCVDDYAQPVVEVISNPNTSEIFTSPSAGTPTGTLIYSSNPDTETPNWNSHQGEITATTFLGDLNGTINTATTGTTQTAGNNSTLIATTAYADAAAAAIPIGDYLPLSAGSGSSLTGTLYGTSTNFSGNGDYAGSMTLGTGASTAEANLQIGQGRTGNGYSYIDLIGDATYTDYGLRIIRNNAGANTSSAIMHRGTGNLEISSAESSSTLFKTNSTTALTLTNTQNAIFTGNVGIGTTNPTNYKLEVDGTVEGSAFSVDGASSRIFAPAGATYNGNGTQTGYLIAKLPDNGASGVNNMMTGVIRVFDYTFHESFDIHFAGYWYSGYNWTNCTAWIDSSSYDDRNFTVRFGAMTGAAGAGTRPYITIGEGSSTWTYCKFSVINYEPGHSNYQAYKWNSGWSMDISVTNPGVVASAISNCQVNNWARNGQDLYYGSGSGNVGIGTTNPRGKLDITNGSTGQTYGNISGLLIDVNGTSNSYYGLKVGSSTGNSHLAVTNAGNVGIGTDSPGEKLEVSGNVKAETLIATDLTDGYVPYSKSGTLGLQDSKIYTNGAHIGVGTTTLAAGCHITSLSDISATGYRVAAMQTAPSSRGDTGTLGEIRITADYIYVCYATDSWKRVAIAQW
jgi:hypothetical protein